MEGVSAVPTVQRRAVRSRLATWHTVVVAGTALCAAYGMAARALFPTADEMFDRALHLGTSAGDEGWLHAARIWAVFDGQWLPEDVWHTQAVAFVPNALTYLVFRVLGPSELAVRLLPVALGIATVTLAWLYATRAWGHLAGVLTLCFLTPLVPLIGFSRVGMVEPFLVFFVMLLYWLAPRYRRHPIGMCCVGLLCAVAWATKSSVIVWLVPFVGVLVLDGLWRIVRGQRVALRELLLLLCGTASGMMAWLLWLARDPQGVALWHFFVSIRVGLGESSVFWRLVHLITGTDDRTLIVAPVLCVSFLVAAGYLVTHPRHSADFATALLAITLIGTVALHVGLGLDDSGRRVLLLWLPLGLLTARGLSLLLARAPRWRHGRTVTAGVGLLVATHVVQQMTLAIPLLAHPAYTYAAAETRMAQLIPRGQVVLGNGAAAIDWSGGIYPLYWTGVGGIGYIGSQTDLRNALARYHVRYRIVQVVPGDRPAGQVLLRWRGRESRPAVWDWVLLRMP